MTGPVSCMRICFVCNEYPPSPHGGIGTATRILARALVRRGHEVRVVGAYAPQHRGAEYEEDEGVRVWRMRTPGGRMGWLPARYHLYRTIARWVHDGEVQVIEVPDWAGWAAGWPRLTVPVVARLNGSATYFAAELGRSIDRATLWLERASFRRADFWCAVSRYTAEKTPPLFGRSSIPRAILFNPVDLPPEWAANPRSKRDVIFTGTLTEKKGIASLIRAWPKVLQHCPDAELRIFGKDGRNDKGISMQASLLAQLDETSQRSIRFFGHQPRETLYQALQRARVAVFPSYAEAFALAPLEAMACGCPTIYSTRGSGPELIEHGSDGLLVAPDRPDDIASQIVQVLSDDELARRLGRAGRERVQTRFTIAALISANEDFYRSCIDDFQSAPANGKVAAA